MAAVNKLTILSRGMCTSTSLVKPPMQVFGIDGRYATALYSAASKMKQLEQVEKDLSRLQTSVRGHRKFRELLTSPIIDKKVMATALKDAATKLSMAPATANLLGLLADNGRLKRIDGIITAFNDIMASYRGEVVCEIVTAKPLDASQNKQLEAALKSFLKSNESIKITSRVDPLIIGGMVVSIGDKYIDMSIASKVKMYADVIASSA